MDSWRYQLRKNLAHQCWGYFSNLALLKLKSRRTSPFRAWCFKIDCSSCKEFFFKKKWRSNLNHHLLHRQEPVRLSLWLTMQTAALGTWKPYNGLSNTLSVGKTPWFFSESCLSSGRSPPLPVSLSLAIFQAYVSTVNSTFLKYEK